MAQEILFLRSARSAAPAAVMPVHEAGFKLVPWSFFDRNPALDLP